MRYVMFSWVDPADAVTWDTLSPAEKDADTDRYRAWFVKHRDQIVGGEELDYPPSVKALRRGRQGEGVIVTDGPFLETKEILGGFVILDVTSIEEAVAIASEWPSLSGQRNATVQVRKVLNRENW
jgi:hypothetical protein